MVTAVIVVVIVLLRKKKKNIYIYIYVLKFLLKLFESIVLICIYIF